MSQNEQNDKGQYFYRASAADFQKIPGGSIGYWLSQKMLSIFEENDSLAEHCVIREGINTGDNDKFLRRWHEVSLNTFCLPERFDSTSGFKWFAHKKGGEFRKWFGNREFILNWESDGKDIHDFHHLPLDFNGAPVRGKSYFFKPGLSWSRISSGSFALRFYESGMTYDSTAPSIYAEPNTLLKILGLLNSKLVFRLLEGLSPTLDFRITSLGRLPFAADKISFDSSNDLAPAKLIELSKLDWNTFEHSWDFAYHPLIKSSGASKLLVNSYQQLRSHFQDMTSKMWFLEKENNKFFIEAYNLETEISSDVPLTEVSLNCNPYYRYGGERTEQEYESLLLCDTVKDLLSYLIGCLMGRYSIDKPGLILASQGETLQDYLNQIPNPRFMPDNDSILPLTDQEWFVDDVTNRVREFVKVVWGEETLQENLAFIAESLCLHAIKALSTRNSRGESSIETIRRYLSTQFYKDHLKTYKKRPIYWLFSSGKEKAFECLVYLHRYNESTLARMRTEYVTLLMGKYDAQQSLLQEQLNDASPAQQRDLEKQLKDLAKKQTELRAFDENLKHYADMRIKLDLDDGVKVNYGKFGNLLADVKAITGDKE